MPVVLKRPASASVQAGSSVVVTLPVAQAASKPEWYSSGDGKVQLPIYLVTAAKLVNAEDVVSEPPLQAYTVRVHSEYNQSTFRVHSEYNQSI